MTKAIRPTQIKIVGKQHSISFVPTGHDALLEGTDALAGSILHDRQQIYIEDDQPLESEQDTLFHEVLHGIERAMDVDIPETATRRLATGIIAVLKDNPGFRAYLARKKR